MESLNKQSTERISLLESSNGNYEKMLIELHNNNNVKAQAMEAYEKRLTLISDNTEHTTKQVDILKNNSTRTEKKVDKLRVAMKTFIKVMTYVLGPNKNRTE